MRGPGLWCPHRVPSLHREHSCVFAGVSRWRRHGDTGARQAMAGRTCVSFWLLLSPLVIWEGRPSWGEGRPAAPGPCKMGSLESQTTWTHVCAGLLPRSAGWVQAHVGRAFGLVRAGVFWGHRPRGQRPRGLTAQEGSSCMRKEGKGPQTGPRICISETLRNVWSLAVT